jgi:hypothetical protein
LSPPQDTFTRLDDTLPARWYPPTRDDILTF